jgi:hypothetical protein
MKHYERLAVEYSKRFAKGWDYFCLSCDAFSAGYKRGTQDHYDRISPDDEVEFNMSTDGTHQLTIKSFLKNKRESEQLPFKELVKTYLPMVDLESISVHEKDGVISFQGVAKRKESSGDSLTYIEE